MMTSTQAKAPMTTAKNNIDTTSAKSTKPRPTVIVNEDLSPGDHSRSVSSPLTVVVEGGAVPKTEESPKTVRETTNFNTSVDKTKSDTGNKKRKIGCLYGKDSESPVVPDLAYEDSVISVNYGFDFDCSDDENENDNDNHKENQNGNGKDYVAETDCTHNIELQEPNKRVKRSYPSDLIVVLDMDECLIHLETQEQRQERCINWEFPFPNCFPDDDQDKENKNACDVPARHESEFMYVDENKVLLRPGLIKFLKFVTTRFETHIFTAGTKEYADAILDQLCVLLGDADAFSKRWYREDCETIDIWDPCTTFHLDRTYVKPLSKVAEWAGRDAQDLRRIVHVDDRVQNFLLNHDNGIQVSGWRGDDPNDEDLSKVTKVLQQMDHNSIGDVRPHLRKEFSESYLELKGQLDMMHFFAYNRKKGIDSQLFEE
mmetsp:Transcript_11820/g.33943  ORF Transcript_11820/g.33943 Transcript_11820/m.33943 type:complete len:429 (-) Transcript_11820:108-1394(-)